MEDPLTERDTSERRRNDPWQPPGAWARRRSQENVERLSEAFRRNPDQPMRVIWEVSRDEVPAALAHELLALGHQRPAVRAELIDATDQVRRLQVGALSAHAARAGVTSLEVSMPTLLFLLAGIPKLIRLEEGVGVAAMHHGVLDDFEPPPARPGRWRPAPTDLPRDFRRPGFISV